MTEHTEDQEKGKLTPEAQADLDALDQTAGEKLQATEPAPAAPAAEENPETKPADPGEELPVIDPSVLLTSAGLVSATTGILASILGDEWLTESQEEFNEMSNAVEGYMRSKGVSQVSPEWTLATAFFGYVGKRMHKPKTRGKIGMMIAWIRARFQR